MSVFEFLKNSNVKLGPGVYTFSLPPVTTCPGRGECENFCYAVNMARRWPSYRGYLERVKEAVEDPSWIDAFVEEANRKKNLKDVRVHVSGDFFSAKYAREWIKVVRKLPEVKFFGYTRSWIVPRIVKSIEDLRDEPNVSLYASVEDGEINDRRAMTWMKALVIDDYTSPIPLDGIICPEQMYRYKTKMDMGKKTEEAATCSTCRYCIKGKGNIAFVKH